MNASSIISHRMFVAALGQTENGGGHKPSPASAVPAGPRGHGARAPQYRLPSSSPEPARQLWFAALNEGLNSAET